MRKGDKRWIAVGLLVAVTGGGLLVVRHHRAEQAMRRPAVDGAPSPGSAPAPVETPAWRPETPEAIAAEVARSMAGWRRAILVKDADTVVSLDRVFLESPDRYRVALEISAKSDGDERVRAFSTRVLGKLKSPALAQLFATLLADRSQFVRQNAAWALGELAAQEDGRIAARQAAAGLRQARAKDPAAEVRAAAEGALARLE